MTCHKRLAKVGRARATRPYPEVIVALPR